MALFLFPKAILQGQPLDLFKHGKMVRDFTYIHDIVEAVIRVLDKPATPYPASNPAQPDPATSDAPHRVFNIGNSLPTLLMDFIQALEAALGHEAQKNYLPMQAGDVPATNADTRELYAWFGFKPDTHVTQGAQLFVEWYRELYKS